MVHKGELKASDGSIKPVAIKTIKCKLCVIHVICTHTYIMCFV